jgi:hypothetical protein
MTTPSPAPPASEPEDDTQRQECLQFITRRLVIFTLVILAALAVTVYSVLLLTKREGSILVLLVFAAGLLGGFVSIQQRLPRISGAELRVLANSWISITLIPINGGIFAMVLMFVFIGGIVQGELFPNYPEFKISNVTEFFNWIENGYPLTGADVSKLLFWAFVAGFSERFVPQVIMKVSKQADAKPAPEGK